MNSAQKVKCIEFIGMEEVLLFPAFNSPHNNPNILDRFNSMSSFSLNTTTPSPSPLNFTLNNSTSSSSSSTTSLFEEQTERGEATSSYTTTPTCCYNSFKLNPPFDSAMALTVLLLITALFFMAFFSVYVRRFADESSVDPTRRRTRASTATARVGKGVDPAVVESLPSYVYGGGGGGDVEKGSVVKECAICLGEFEVKDLVKEIPYCGHVFHGECIDLWLASHVTCPLCRTTQFFPSGGVKSCS